MSLDLQYDVIPWEPNAQNVSYCKQWKAGDMRCNITGNNGMGVGGDCPGYTNNILQVSC